MRDEQHPNQDEANIPDQNKQTDSLEESLSSTGRLLYSNVIPSSCA